MPKVSVVIPTCNRAHFLHAAIESVLKQTFQDFEVIVVDDASTDETADVVRGFSDARIRYLRHETNKGQGATRNDGIKQAAGDYVALLDDDDEWLAEKLGRQVALLENSSPNVGLIYSGFCQIDASTKRVVGHVIPEKRGQAIEDLRLKNWIGTCSTVLVRRVCFEKVGLFDEKLASAADYDMWIRVAKNYEIDYVPELLVFYTVHGNRISTNHESLIRGLEGLLKKHAPYFALNSKNYGRRYSSLGTNYCFNGNTKKGRKAFLQAIKLYPFELRHYYNLCLSLLGANKFRRLKAIRRGHLGQNQ
ncbi:MAG: glycosyltransferase [Deltaproteobacteria bacterium]|nr:glycosyltransferase [Deltaproteobacteria bacterium]